MNHDKVQKRIVGSDALCLTRDIFRDEGGKKIYFMTTSGWVSILCDKWQ